MMTKLWYHEDYTSKTTGISYDWHHTNHITQRLFIHLDYLKMTHNTVHFWSTTTDQNIATAVATGQTDEMVNEWRTTGGQMSSVGMGKSAVKGKIRYQKPFTT